MSVETSFLTSKRFYNHSPNTSRSLSESTMEVFIARPRCTLLLFSIVAASLLSPSAAYNTAVKYCDQNTDYAVKVKGVEISPFPVSPGKKTTFSIDASTENALSKGKLVIDVSYIGIHVREETHELCKETSCPVSTGDFVLAHHQTLPFFTPPGSYSLLLKLLGEDDVELTCVTFEFSISWFSEVAEAAEI